jgi:hypothetical protein
VIDGCDEMIDQYDEPVKLAGELEPASNREPAGNLEALSDRLREVRRQLSRGKPLAGAIEHHHHSDAALRAAQRLEAAVRRLDAEAPMRRVSPHHEVGRHEVDAEAQAQLPWLVRVVERRACVLDALLQAAHRDVATSV